MFSQASLRLNMITRSESRVTDVKKMSARVLGSMRRVRFNALQHDIHDRLGQTGKMVITLAFAVREDPRGYYLINSSEEAMCSNGHGEFRPKDLRLLAVTQHALNEIEVFDHHVVGELAQELRAMTQFGLEDDRQTAVGAQRFQVQKSHAPQFFPRVSRVLQRRFGAGNEAVEGGVNRRHQELVFVLEVEVDRAIGHAGAFCDFGHAGVKEAVPGNHFNCRIKDALVLVRADVDRARAGWRRTFHKGRNECTWIHSAAQCENERPFRLWTLTLERELPFIPAHKLPESLATMAQRGLLVKRKFSKCPAERWKEEKGVVAEALIPSWDRQNLAMRFAAKSLRESTVFGGSNHADILSGERSASKALQLRH